jgi:hypothetical protein
MTVIVTTMTVIVNTLLPHLRGDIKLFDGVVRG